MSGLVSIITPSYNSARFINECVGSVIEQTYTNWELIIVDDASEDNSREFISTIAASDDRIKFVFLTENIGAAGARNIALEKSKGRYICFIAPCRVECLGLLVCLSNYLETCCTTIELQLLTNGFIVGK